MKKRTIALMLALVLVIGCAVGGTIAWLTAESSDVVNTFTTSDIGVGLKETTTNYQMIPGWDIAKDPKAWIETGSEDAYLFVKVEKSENFNTFMEEIDINDAWTPVPNVADVYYIKVTDSSKMGETNAFEILKDNKVTVKGEVTKEMMTAEDFTQPTLTFTAYAHQLYSKSGTEFDVNVAWDNIINPTTAE